MAVIKVLPEALAEAERRNGIYISKQALTARKMRGEISSGKIVRKPSFCGNASRERKEENREKRLKGKEIPADNISEMVEK